MNAMTSFRIGFDTWATYCLSASLGGGKDETGASPFIKVTKLSLDEYPVTTAVNAGGAASSAGASVALPTRHAVMSTAARMLFISFLHA
jgi:hypothetical protein